ncbi:signal transduction histidine kinase [Candidatus Scalindua japonica]|uniref:histidine kinase n=1 Tax=Candidatus Scalindua japonica TaxID=1284222 RepID=A0A286U1S2_9BACT|nr:ATP-binding protein [Candidatus Scalindua japonica]GAX62093.1 signal transduction histidine kinase [Candidatus Scalindua japonica]
MFETENILGIVVADKYGIIKSVSPGNGNLPSSLIGMKWYDAFPIPDKEINIVEKRSPEVFRLCESGKKLSVFPSYDKEGSFFGFHILVEKNCEGERYSQFLNKVLCLGKIVPGIAHEINNPLSYVSGWLQMFLDKAQDTDPQKKTYETLICEFERIANLANSLLDFTRQTARPKKIFDINDVIEDVITMVGYTMKNENVEIIKNLASSEIEVYGESDKLKQVFINVIQNARDAMPDGGTICINTNIFQDDLYMVQFSDTGCGIIKDQLNEIFCSSYTSKADGNGSGLGLPVCKTIIEEFGGAIDLESKIGEGTVVSIKLPNCSAKQNEHY